MSCLALEGRVTLRNTRWGAGTVKVVKEGKAVWEVFWIQSLLLISEL
jgi:hypothetical protein